jgi:hypothetical protein
MNDGEVMGDERRDTSGYEGDKLGEGLRLCVGGCSWVVVKSGGSS